MDSLETPYEEEAEFIECTVCDKSIRGETLYKIHLTTPGHIKKEDALIAAGRAVRHHIVPEFKDILHYLDYLNLDEPIIGLSFLDEVPCNEPQGGLRYTCRLCHQTSNLAEMVHHVIGRKHRQKYVELKRPDLVTWDKQSLITQVGKIIRARAEIIERQDGRGSPLQIVKRGTEGKLNISRVPPKEKQNRNRYVPQRPSQQNIPPLLPELKDYRNEHSQLVRYPSGYPNTAPFYTEEPDMDRDRHMYKGDITLSGDVEEDLRRADYRKSDMYNQDHMDPNYHREYGEKYVEDPRICSPRDVPKPGGVSRYDSGEVTSHNQAQHVEYYPEEAPPYRSPYSEDDPLKEFYSEEVRRGRVRSAEFQSTQRVYPENAHQRSLERESGRQYSKAGGHGSREPESKRGGFPTPVESDQSHNHFYHIVRDYCHEKRDAHQEEAMSATGRQVEITRSMSDIPEPFKRFLKGATNDEGHSKRKRKSRFSDATIEEVEMTKEMFGDEYGPPNPKFGGCPRPVVQLRPEIQGKSHPNCYTESQSLHYNKSYQKGSFGTDGVFDMLKNVEIENAEEAAFLKNKLSSLLKEFTSKKSEKAVQNIQSRADINNDYNTLKMDLQYERPLREDSEFRQAEIYFREDQRERCWKEHEHVLDKQLTEHHHLGHGEPRYSNRNHSKEHYGWPEMSWMPHDEPAHYSERFPEPRDYQPAAEEHFSSAPPLHMERDPSMHRGTRYSKNLDKITSTLLELVARK